VRRLRTDDDICLGAGKMSDERMSKRDEHSEHSKHSDRLDSFLDRVCAKIPAADKAAELRAEILDHIECKISFYMDCGHNYEEAVERAVTEMGETEHVAEQLGSIHSRVPHLDMNNALQRIVIGLLIQFFSIDIGMLRSIMTIIGVFLVFSGMLQIRKSNAKMRDASIASAIQYLFQAVVFLVSVAPITRLDEGVSLAISFIAGIIQIVFLSMLGSGLSSLIVSSSGGFIPPEFSSLEIKIRRIGLLYLILFVMALLGTFDQGMSNLMVIPFIILSIMILSRLLKTRRFLLIQRFGTNIDEIRKPVCIGLAFAGVLVLILPWIMTMILYSIPNTFWHKSTYTQSEQVAAATEQIGQAEFDNITHVFTENKVNMEILQTLPASEIARLEGLVEIYSLVQSVSVHDGDLENHSLILVKANGSAEAIQWFKWVEAPTNGGWDTVFLPRGQWHFSESEPHSRIYIFNSNEASNEASDEVSIVKQKPVRIRPGNQPYTVSGEHGNHMYKEYDYFDYAVSGEAGQTVMICSTVDEWLASNIFRIYKSDVSENASVSTDGGVSAPDNIDIVTDDYEVELNYSRLGGMFNYGDSGFSNQFPGCVYISRDKFKPHSYSTSLELASLAPIHVNEGFGYTQSYATSVLEVLDR
jgi:hypothetical protein